MKTTERMREGGLVMWFGVLAGIGAWIIHLTLLASMVEFTCSRKGSLWVLHLATAILGAVTAAAMWVCVGMIRTSSDDEAAETLAGNNRFLGTFGLLTGAVSLALILAEGSYVFFLSPCE